MKKNFTLLIVLIGISASAQINKPIGINISSIRDYSTELTFTDAFKHCRKWLTSNAAGGGAWDTQLSVPLNSNGYPLEIPYNDGINPPQLVKTLMLWDIGTSVPRGMYRLVVTGNGQVRLSQGASGTFNCPIDTFVNVTGQVVLEITQSTATNPINNIKFVYPDYVNSFQTQTFTNEFLGFLKDFQVIRFMDFTRTNFSPNVNWSDRTIPTTYSQAQVEGVAWEYVIEMANTTQKDIWINIPHQATDDYIKKLAIMMQNNLNPNSKIYLEYSNEIWNSQFSQNRYCASMGLSLGYTGEAWVRTWKYTAKRSADVHKIFEDVFTIDSRLIKTIPSHAANDFLTNQLVAYYNDPVYNPNQVKASAIAIAPYFGGVTPYIIDNIGTITTAEIVEEMRKSLSISFTNMINNKTIATTNNLDLIAYEGGQHLVARGDDLNNTALNLKLIAANHDASLQDVYCDYFDYWYTNIGGMFCHFSSHGTYTRNGSWGVKENFQDVNNPKYLALQNCVFNSNNLSVNESALKNESITIYPNAAKDYLIVTDKYNSSTFEYKMYDSLGKMNVSGISKFGEKLYIDNLTPGLYMMVIKVGENTHTKKILIN